MKKEYTLTEKALKAIHGIGNDAVKAALKEMAPGLFVTFPTFAVGKKSNCLYLLVDANTKIRLTDGTEWTKFRTPIGVPTVGALDMDDYDEATVSYTAGE